MRFSQPMVIAGALWAGSAAGASAAPAFSCGGFAMLGGAQLICSHIDPRAPMQFCNFSWALMGEQGLSVQDGSFMLPPGVQNATVYQGSGFSGQLGNPIVLCQAKRGKS